MADNHVNRDLINFTNYLRNNREFWTSSINAASWWKIIQTYTHSVAVMSIIGYIIGLGDRHLDNILVDLTSGEVKATAFSVKKKTSKKNSFLLCYAYKSKFLPRK